MANDIFPGATYVQLAQWGYPMGYLRPIPDPAKAFSVIHWTAALTSAEAEVDRRTDGSPDRNNATFWVNRDGSIVQALGDPLRMAPWTNGDVLVPDISNPRIAAMVRDGVNANTRSLVTIENIGTYGYPLTPEQEATCAKIIAYYHPKAGLPISRETVVGHYQLNSINRPHCPGVDKSPIDRIVAMAQMGDDMTLKGTPVPPLTESSRRMKTTVVQAGGVGVVRDPTVQGQPYDLVQSGGMPLILMAGKSVTVDWEVTGNTWRGGNKWYGAWMWTSPPEFGYIPAGACGPLVTEVPTAITGYTEAQVETKVAKALSEALPSAKAEAATAVAEAAVAKAEEF